MGFSSPHQRLHETDCKGTIIFWCVQTFFQKNYKKNTASAIAADRHAAQRMVVDKFALQIYDKFEIIAYLCKIVNRVSKNIVTY